MVKIKAIGLFTFGTTVITVFEFSLRAKAQELPQIGKNSIEKIINVMTIEEKVHKALY